MNIKPENPIKTEDRSNNSSLSSTSTPSAPPLSSLKQEKSIRERTDITVENDRVKVEHIEEVVTLHFLFAETGERFTKEFPKLASIQYVKDILYGTQILEGFRVTFISQGQRLLDEKSIPTYPFLLENGVIIVSIFNPNPNRSASTGSNFQTHSNSQPTHATSQQPHADDISLPYNSRRSSQNSNRSGNQSNQSNQPNQSHQSNQSHSTHTRHHGVNSVESQVPRRPTHNSSASSQSSHSEQSTWCGLRPLLLRVYVVFDWFISLFRFAWSFFSNIFARVTFQRQRHAVGNWFFSIQSASLATLSSGACLAAIWLAYLFYGDLLFDSFSSTILFLLTGIFIYFHFPSRETLEGNSNPSSRPNMRSDEAAQQFGYRSPGGRSNFGGGRLGGDDVVSAPHYRHARSQGMGRLNPSRPQY